MNAKTSATTATAQQLMRQQLNEAMDLIAELQECVEDYDSQLERGEDVDLDNVGWMELRIGELKRAAEGFGLI